MSAASAESEEVIKPHMNAEEFKEFLTACKLGTLVRYSVREVNFQSSPGIPKSAYFLGAANGMMCCVGAGDFDSFIAGGPLPAVEIIAPVTAFGTIVDLHIADVVVDDAQRERFRLFVAGTTAVFVVAKK